MSTRKKKKDQIGIGTMIKHARKECGLSQKELANFLHVSDKTISSYEVGRATPNIDILKRISRAVNKPLAYFDEDQPKDIDLQIKLAIIERELLEVKKLLQKKK